MSNGLVSIEIQNYRSIANLKLELGSLNVLFGPNGVGKSTFLDAVLFLADCVKKDVGEAAAKRGQGISLLWDGSGKTDNILIALETLNAAYRVSIAFSQGRIDLGFGESLEAKSRQLWDKEELTKLSLEGLTVDQIWDKDSNSQIANFLKGLTPNQIIKRDINDWRAMVLNEKDKKIQPFDLSSNTLLLSRYAVIFQESQEAVEINNLLLALHFHKAREDNLARLQRLGSQASHLLTLSDESENLWSVLGNLKQLDMLDDRHSTIMSFMRKSFPTFKHLVVEPTGNTSVYASMYEEGRRQKIPASGMSDGHLQMLINLTALFSEEKGKTSLILFDEPETSLHPHAIAQFAEAVKLATREWGRQVFIATHSPVLLSQFKPEDILTIGLDDNRATVMQRVSEIENIKDLLEEYALGSLYMAEAIAPQSKTFSEV